MKTSSLVKLGISALRDRRKLITKRGSCSNALNPGLVAQSERASSAQLALTPATATQRTSNVKPELAPRLKKTMLNQDPIKRFSEDNGATLGFEKNAFAK